MTAPPEPTRPMPDPSVLRDIRMLLTDVDGVLTDGTLNFDTNGYEYKTFHVHDAAGFVYWNRSGLISGFLSGRDCVVVRQRAAELGIHEPLLGRLDKGAALQEILSRHPFGPEQIAYVGDDLLDLPILKVAGFAVSVPNGRPEVRAAAHHVTSVPGGQGAVREVIEILLEAKGLWNGILEHEGLMPPPGSGPSNSPGGSV